MYNIKDKLILEAILEDDLFFLKGKSLEILYDNMFTYNSISKD